MRLDHLLSKERLLTGLVSVIQSPVCPRVWGSGCSRVEHRLFGAFLVVTHKYKSSSFGMLGSGTWWWSGWVPDTLLGPEGSDDARRLPPLWGWVWCVPAGFFWSWALPMAQLVCVGCGVPVVF